MIKLISAPMATLSHEAFRRCVEKFGGCDEYFTEMINASSLITMGPFEKYYLFSGPVPEKIVWQLTGWEKDTMHQAAKILASKEGLGIDLNMGCSAPQIYKTGAGISWMLKPIDETRQMVRLVKDAMESGISSASQKRLSVKCRLGDDDFTQETFLSFTDMLVDEGVQSITLHPRTKKEKLRGLPRYEFAQLIAKRYADKVDVYVNGEVKDFLSAKTAITRCPSVCGIMIARAAAERPWIFDEINSQFEAEKNGLEYTKTHCVDRKQVALDFINDVVECQPPEFYRTRIQRFFAYYCNQFKFGHYFQSHMLNYKSIEDSIAQVNDYFEKQAEEQFLYY